ncbi:hypothetical protein [Jatrophihabitans sp.]|uniref:hypothetical protein n=1 Tax=Jatrophihabitans sp. TaxID=1932789 RepID=UPI0030C6AC78|nr:hypothetical protein [Jatrophihabitans sp.]
MANDELEFDGWDPDARRRAAWALGVLALVAVIIVGLILIVGGSSGAGKPAAQVAPASGSGPAVIVQPPSSAASSSSSPSSSPTSSTPATPTKTATCASGSGCTLAGDGGLLAALNSLRTKHGLPPVSGTITAAATKCAAADGNTPSCPGSYFWEPVTTQSGSAVLTKIEAQPSGSSFLLSPHLTSVQIGWAHSGTWNCALIEG